MAEKMNVLVASSPRSGGSWLFNAARLVLATKGDVNAAWCEDYDRDHPADYHVVKAHRANQLPFEPTVILTAHRDVAERLASLMRMGWLRNTADAIVAEHRSQLAIYDYWKQRSTLEVEYTTIMQNPAEAILAIAGVLDVALTAEQSREFAAKLSAIEAPADGSYDKTTLLHKNHRSDGRATAAIAAEIREIVAKAG
jgi:hypothetical protein